MNTSKVQVLLSTFNGQGYLRELMDSVLCQDYAELAVLVRDDGSTDGTLQVLEKYRRLHNLQVCQGENLGVVRSFFKLIELSAPEADYFAFCDQDDVWAKDKLSRAINFLKKEDNNLPAMYCSRATLADKNLKILGYTQIPVRELAFGNALVQNKATGCTIVINNAARQLLLRKLPLAAMIHDWWIYLVISAFGKVIYDTESRILYRQHSANAIGEKDGFVAKWAKRIGRFIRHGRVPFVTLQAKEFREIFGEALPADKKILLDRFIDDRSTFVGRLRYAFRGETYRQGTLDDIIFRALIVLDRV